MNIFEAVLLGAVEGFTEFLPISSTGHLIIASELLDFNDPRGQVFGIVIQSGAMIAVMLHERNGRCASATRCACATRRSRP